MKIKLRALLVGILLTFVVVAPQNASAQYVDESFVQRSEISNISKLSGDNPPTYHLLSVFKDPNMNGRRGSAEECLNRNVTYEFTRPNGTKFERSIWGCTEDIAFVTKARTVTIKLKKVDGFIFTGYNFTDNTHEGAVRLNGRHSQRVIGKFSVDSYYTVIDFGVKKQ